LITITTVWGKPPHQLTTGIWERIRDRQPAAVADVAAWGDTTFDLTIGGERHAASGR
jgi:hypothetical protein